MSRLVFFTNPWGSGEIRGRQVAAAVGGEVDITDVQADDVCIFVKCFPSDAVLKHVGKVYIDVVDSCACIPWLRDHPSVGAIALSNLGGQYLSEVLDREVPVIPEHHCNFERVQKQPREPQVVGYIGEMTMFHLNIAQVECMVETLGMKFVYLNKFKTRKDVCDFYQKIDIQLTFRVDRDDYGRTSGILKNPLKLANAGSFGIPTVGYPEATYIDEFRSWFIPAKSIDEVAYWLDRLKHEPALYADAAGAAYIRADDYHIDKIAPLYRQLLHDVMASSVGSVLNKHQAHKPADYYDVYNRILPLNRDANISILEIGVETGASIRAWCEAYPNASIFGVDCDSVCLDVDTGRAKIFIGKQEDKKFLAMLTEHLPMLDAVIDDGGHFADEQQESFKVLIDKVKPGGVYVIEDLDVALYRTVDGYPCTIDFVKSLPYPHRIIMRGKTPIMAVITKKPKCTRTNKS